MNAKQFFQRVGAWFAAAFTWHNAEAVVTAAAREGEVVADAAKGDIAGVATEQASAVDAAKSIHVDGFTPPKGTKA